MAFLRLTEPFRNVFEFTKYSTQQTEQKTMVSYVVERFLLGRAKLAEICFMKWSGKTSPQRNNTIGHQSERRRVLEEKDFNEFAKEY